MPRRDDAQRRVEKVGDLALGYGRVRVEYMAMTHEYVGRNLEYTG